MGAGVTMSGVLYSTGRTFVRIQEVVVLEVPLVFWAAVKVRMSIRIHCCGLPLRSFRVTLSLPGSSTISIPNTFLSCLCASSNTCLKETRCFEKTIPR